MNVFYIHEDPEICAQQHCDSHASKMCVEYAQLMSTAHRVIDGEMLVGRTTLGRRIKRWYHPNPVLNKHLYKSVHVNHPSAVWVRESLENYEWLYDMWVCLCNEYQHRYGRVHESFNKLEHILSVAPAKIESIGFTQPTPAMKNFPQCIVEGDSLQSYRNYYWEAKRQFARWTKRDKPDWYQDFEVKYG